MVKTDKNGRIPCSELREFFISNFSAQDIEVCSRCDEVFIWSKIPDENVKSEGNGRLEHFGIPCEEMVPVGWTCPFCGHYNSL